MLFKKNGPLLLLDSFFSSPYNPPAYATQNTLSSEKKVIAILIAFVNSFLVHISLFPTPQPKKLVSAIRQQLECHSNH